MIYVIGESVGSGLGYSSSRRMADLIGVEHATFMHQVVWLNLFDIPGTDPARYIAMIDRASSPDDALILLGRRVATAYGTVNLGPLAVVRRHGGMGSTVVNLPHPSGMNRWWNRKDHVEMAGRWLKQIWADHQ